MASDWGVHSNAPGRAQPFSGLTGLLSFYDHFILRRTGFGEQ
jgi:hypothetical protein